MQLIFALFVTIGWYYYLTSSSASTGTLVILLVATAFAIIKMRRFHIATQAAHNVVAAAATFKTLSSSDQNRVHDQAIEILRASGWRAINDPAFEDDAERFGWYALAMAELGIPPACLIKQWNSIRNPFREALNPNHYYVTSIQLAERQDHPVQLQRHQHRK